MQPNYGDRLYTKKLYGLAKITRLAYLINSLRDSRPLMVCQWAYSALDLFKSLSIMSKAFPPII
ncbi:deoxyribonuclease/rho motif-related TRAM [Arthrospira platensis C1]|nr:deoxyribonuclease/rho motif-related TRAM [Arthrospira platensis C1]